MDDPIIHMDENMDVEKIVEKTSLKRKVSDSNVLQCYTKLTCPVEKDRMNAAVFILKKLTDAQEKSQDDDICSELSYAIQRLVRGIGTPRMNARNGFFATLVTLLSTFPQISVTKVMEFITKELVSTSKSTKSEKSEEMMGQVLAYGALIQSGTLLLASREEQQLVLTKLVTAAGERSYLPVIAYTFLVKLLDQMNAKQFKRIMWPVLKPRTQVFWPQQTIDTFYFLLRASTRFPDVVNEDFMTEALGCRQLVSTETLEQCCHLLMTIPRRANLLHPVYEEFIKHLASSGLALAFWTGFVELQLAKPSKLKELIAAEMFQLLVAHVVDKAEIAGLFTPCFVRLLVRSGQKKRADRDECSVKLEEGLECVINAVKDAGDDAIVAIVRSLLFYPGSFHIEQTTGYKIIWQLTAHLKIEGVKQLVKIYCKVLEGKIPKVWGPDGQTEPWHVNDRVKAAQMYTRLLAHPSLQTDIKFKAKKLQPLLTLGFFQSDLAISGPASMLIKDCFYKALDQKVGQLDNLLRLLSAAVAQLNAMVVNDRQRATLRQPAGAKVMAAWNGMIAVVKQFEGNTTLTAGPLFHTMFLQLGLQLFADSKLAMEALQELHSCYERVSDLAKGCAATKQRKLKEGDLEEGEPDWTEVAVDLLLSLLSHTSHLLRSLVMCVFPHLAPHLTPSAAQQILHVFDTKADNNLLSAYGYDESEDEDDGDSGEEEDSGEKEDSGGSDDGDSWDEGDGEKETVTDKLRLAVQQALGTAASLTDTESVDLDDIDSDEGARLDSALSDAFKQMHAVRGSTGGKAKKQAKPDEALMHFRARVINLLEATLAVRPAMSTCLDMIVPLFQLLEFAMRNAHQKPLENKARACLKKLAAVRSWSDSSNVSETQLVDLLRSLLDQGDRPAPVYLDMMDECAACCTFLVRCSQQLRADGKCTTPDAVEGQYRAAVENFMLKRECLLNTALFKSALQLTWPGNWSLAADLVQLSFSVDVRLFKRQQALQLLRTFYAKGAVRDPVNAASLARLNKQLLANARKLLLEQSSPSAASLKYLAELLVLLKSVRHADSLALTSKAWSKFGAALTQFSSEAPMNAAVASAVRALCSPAVLGINFVWNRNGTACPTAKKKKKNENGIAITNGNSSESESEDVLVAKDKVKSKKRKTNEKLKKESKNLRISSLSEGFQHTNFTFRSDENSESSSFNGKDKTVNGKTSEKRKLAAGSSENDHKKLK